MEGLRMLPGIWKVHNQHWLCEYYCYANTRHVGRISSQGYIDLCFLPPLALEQWCSHFPGLWSHWMREERFPRIIPLTDIQIGLNWAAWVTLQGGFSSGSCRFVLDLRHTPKWSALYQEAPVDWWTWLVDYTERTITSGRCPASTRSSDQTRDGMRRARTT